MLTWIIDHSAAIAVLCTLVLAALGCLSARHAHCRMTWLDREISREIDHLARHLGLTPDDLEEAHCAAHPGCRPVERDGGA